MTPPPMSVAAFVALLCRHGITLEVIAGDASTRAEAQLIARPRAQVTPELAVAIRAYKLVLVRTYRSQPPITPIACQCCRGEFVSSVGQRCRWCEQLRGREVVYEPNSPAERRFLADLERAEAERARFSEGLQGNPPTVPAAKSGTVGQLGEFFGPESTENRAQTVGQWDSWEQLSHQLSHAGNA